MTVTLTKSLSLRL